MKAALLFDLDGTLIDSDGHHLAAFQRVFGRYGVTVDLPQYNAGIHGASNVAIGRRFLHFLPEDEQREALEAKEAAFRSGLAGVEPIAGANELLAFAERRGFGCAVVTNAPRANVDAALEALNLAERIAVVIVGEELPRSKPDPLPYLTALERTGAAAALSVAFEDSPTGVQSAAAAGLAVVGVMSSLDEPALVAAGARFAVRDFTDPRIYELIEARIGAPGTETIA